MKAWILRKHGQASEAFSLEARPDLVPAAGQVRIQVAAFGLNYADVMARKGLYREAPPLPSIIGYEVAGTVLDWGNGVSGFEKGQRVVAITRFGGYASQAVTDARAVVPIAEEMDFASALCLAIQYATAYYVAEECVSLFPGAKVLVHAAAGGVGTGLLQLCALHQCETIASVGSEEKFAWARENGARHVIQYRKTDYRTEVKRIAGKEGLDFVFDSLGGKIFRDSFKLLGAGGKIVGYGAADRSNGGILELLKLVLGYGFLHPVQLLIPSKGMIGVNMLRIADEKPEILKQALEGLVTLFREGKIKPRLGKVFSANELATAHHFVEERKSMGKVALVW